MQKIFRVSDIINNNTIVIHNLAVTLTAETLYESCDIYVGFEANLLDTVTINYTDSISSVTVEKLTRMAGNIYAMHFVLDRNYYIGDSAQELFVASGRVQTTNTDVYRDFSFIVSQTGSHLEFTDGAYITIKAHQDSTMFGLTSRSNNQKTLEYFTEQASGWKDLTTATAIAVNSGQCVYIRGILSGDNSIADYTRFSITGSASVSGNLNSLWDYRDLSTALHKYCGYTLFEGCAGLVDASGLTLGTSATTLADYCYYFMFQNCTSLTTAPSRLPATTLANSCCSNMFLNCTSLTTAPELPATTLANYCYGFMFNGCTSLTTAPELPATTLADSCYFGMFKDCTSLITVPVLPAITLANKCYDGMFEGCTSLTAAPELPAADLRSFCYYRMFSGCTNLIYIKCLAINNITIDSATVHWMDNVPSGQAAIDLGCTFVKHPDASWSSGLIPPGWINVDCPETLCVTNIDSTATTISMPVRLQETAIVSPDVSYSKTHGQSWAQWSYDNDNITLQPGECVYLRGSNHTGFSEGIENIDSVNFNTRQLYITGGKVELSGNIMGLLDNGACTSTTIPNTSCFMELFGYNTLDPKPSIRYAHRLLLPATAATKYCYSSLFRNCDKLLTAPQLPITNLAGADGCYNHMFRSCSSLKEPPELPATVLGNDCYGHMFDSCSSLKRCPELIAQTVVHNCYAGMFSNCTSIKEPPELISTTVAEDCYYGMFAGCINLEYAPDLLATTTEKECYAYMFRNCKKIKKSPVILATELVGGSGSTESGSCQYMFSGCSSLKEIICLATSGTQNEDKSTQQWVTATPNRGVIFVKHPNAVWTAGANGIKTGWTVYNFENYITS